MSEDELRLTLISRRIALEDPESAVTPHHTDLLRNCSADTSPTLPHSWLWRDSGDPASMRPQQSGQRRRRDRKSPCP